MCALYYIDSFSDNLDDGESGITSEFEGMPDLNHMHIRRSYLNFMHI